jgi:hypothetical protein
VKFSKSGLISVGVVEISMTSNKIYPHIAMLMIVQDKNLV